MSSAPSYRINSPTVVHETIDNEVVIIDFDTGTYFSLDNVGALIWNDLAAGMTIEDINAHVCRRYGRDRQEVAPATAQFLAELEQAGLILAVAPAATPGSAGSLDANDEAPADRPYAPPLLNRYSDMQQLLLLDPIHDVDETGWPNLPEERNADAG